MKPSKRDQAYFKTRVLHWQQRLGLIDWHITVNKPVKGSSTARGEVTYSLSNHSACIYLSSGWAKRPTEPELDRVAFHECMHLVTAPMAIALKQHLPESRGEEPHDMEHVVIRLMENVVLGLP